MGDERFRIIKQENGFVLKDNDNKLDLKHKFHESDCLWLKELILFLNKYDNTLQDVTLEYINSVNDLNSFKSKILSHLQDEIYDCEVVLKVDEYDPYTQGRLVELHNIMKVLL